MTYAVTAQGDRLEVEDVPDSGIWKKIGEIKSIPEIGETAVKVDASNLESEMREYIKGLSDQNDLEFTFNAIPAGIDGSNVDLMRGLSRNGEYRFRWVSPRLGIQVIWRGEFAYRFGAGEVDTVRDLIVTVIPKTRPIESLISSQYTVTYDKNGGTGEMTDESSPYDNAAKVTVKANTFTPPDSKKFVFWNTKADASGDSYDEGDSFFIYKDTTLYAIWSE